MNKISIELSKKYFESQLGVDIESVQPIVLTGMNVIEILWPLNDIFRPHLEKIKTIKYRSRCEAGADSAIEEFSKNPSAETWRDLPPGVWRVLLERHQQMLVVAAANHAQGNMEFSYLPKGLPEAALLSALMLVWLHGMELPFPIEDRSQLEIPEHAPEGPFRLQ